MLRHCGRREFHHDRHLTDAERPAAKDCQETEANRVADGLVGLNEAGKWRHRHFVN
jgi:hypothetical protein